MNTTDTDLLSRLNFSKSSDGLLPVVVQDIATSKVLMLGYMNMEALEQTMKTGLVTFYSRSKGRLWVKGETSKHYLHVNKIIGDCDDDTLLIKASPAGPVCHTGADTCFNEKNRIEEDFLYQLERIIADRKANTQATSYTSSLFQEGINKIAQKVGEEVIELIIEAKDNNEELFKNEAADLIFHLLVLLQQKNCPLNDIMDVLKERHHK
jgi:phosphoribosyl-ATP pyrophosphohydrolase/phosphoribosyl-AMP cyclohydrolase